MGRSHYSANKRRREADKARKKREKQERRRRNRDRNDDESEFATVEEIQGAAMQEDEPEFEDLSVVAPRQAPKQPSRLFVGGLARGATADDLRSLFEEYGDVQDATVVTDSDTGESRGFGFVTMLGHRAAGRAIQELNDSEFLGRRLHVDRSTERKGRSHR